jgi:hypothetical protein
MHRIARTLSVAAVVWVVAGAAEARFLQTDPVGYQADMNLYVYVGINNVTGEGAAAAGEAEAALEARLNDLDSRVNALDRMPVSMSPTARETLSDQSPALKFRTVGTTPLGKSCRQIRTTTVAKVASPPPLARTVRGNRHTLLSPLPVFSQTYAMARISANRALAG